MINGRSMPDDMDPNYAVQYPHQPYNGNPHMHPGEQVLLRIIGQGRWQHPFHEHGNHVRILGRDGNLILSATDPNSLAGPLLFTTTTTPGLAMDGIFYWTGKGLNWDVYGHNPASGDPNAKLPCIPDANGYNTGASDGNQLLRVVPGPQQAAASRSVRRCRGRRPGDIAGCEHVYQRRLVRRQSLSRSERDQRATGCSSDPRPNPATCGNTGSTPPSGTIANSPGGEAGFAFMWHSHNEREITTNNIFPGGMMMMMLVDSREFVIDESN